MKKKGPKGAVQPIRDKEQIAKIKHNLARRPRDLCLFTLGCNTAFRASDLLALNVKDVRGADVLRVTEKKTGKTRIVPLNDVCRAAIAVITHGRGDDEPLFVGEKRGTRLTVCTLSRLWAKWGREVGLTHISSHSGRKTWGYTQRMRGAKVELLMKAYNHSSAAVTLNYLGILDEEVEALYETNI